MIRVLGIFIGLGFVLVSAWSLGNGVYAYVSSPPEQYLATLPGRSRSA